MRVSLVADASDRDTDGHLPKIAELATTDKVTRPGRSNSWDSHMADTIAFLISARASLLELTSEPSNDLQDEGVLTSVSAKVEEALSALDDLSVANWAQGACVASLGHSLACLPTWNVCLDGQV
jgi:hypothetical protein